MRTCDVLGKSFKWWICCLLKWSLGIYSCGVYTIGLELTYEQCAVRLSNVNTPYDLRLYGGLQASQEQPRQVDLWGTCLICQL